MAAVPYGMVFDGENQPLRRTDFAWPELKAGEALVEIKACTLCGSDLHSYFGRRPTPLPTILGHEMVGEIVELTSEAPLYDLRGQPLQIGDRVTWSIVAHCGKCFYCLQGLPQKCERLYKYGHQALPANSRPSKSERTLSGGLASHCQLIAGTSIIKLPQHIPQAVACPANCATATVAAAWRTCGLPAGQTVVIMGAGMLGLTASAMAIHHGASEVIVVDVDDQRLQLAKAFGATAVVKADDPGLQPAIADVTSGRGADAVLEMSGATSAARSALQLLRIGGRLVLVGAVFPGPTLEVSPEQLIRRLLRVEGVHNYTPEDLLTAVDFLAETCDDYPFESLVSRSFPLAECHDAFQYAADRRPLRVEVLP